MPRARAAAPAGNDGPPPERWRHDAIERPAKGVYNAEHQTRALAFRACDTIGAMLRNGSASKDQARAGRAFAALFRRAAIPDVRAADPGRIPGTYSLAVDAPEQVRAELRATLDWLCAGSQRYGRAAWYVLGTGMSVAEWAWRERSTGGALSEDQARDALGRTLKLLADLRG